MLKTMQSQSNCTKVSMKSNLSLILTNNWFIIFWSCLFPTLFFTYTYLFSYKLNVYHFCVADVVDHQPQVQTLPEFQIVHQFLLALTRSNTIVTMLTVLLCWQCYYGDRPKLQNKFQHTFFHQWGKNTFIINLCSRRIWCVSFFMRGVFVTAMESCQLWELLAEVMKKGHWYEDRGTVCKRYITQNFRTTTETREPLDNANTPTSAPKHTLFLNPVYDP